ncbi:Panacea domain-containing protein [Actinoplanes sp. NPDC051513]|uniref:Panacea domain-containing protein n=1 Tax=Actinoplanes sp. NPDC051513 TaxID=3363908 RepID=UPI0037AA87C2
MKLQKLLYYAQAWHLVWDDQPLFGERIEAWANGPVVYEVYQLHRGQFTVTDWPAGSPSRLTTSERESVDVVLGTYADLNARKLSHLTHAEQPWQEARHGLHPTDRSSAEITQAAMQEYYSSLDSAQEAVPVDELTWDDWGTTPAATA